MSTDTNSFTNLLPKTNCRFIWGNTPLTEAKWQTNSFYDLSADLSFEKALAILSEELSFCEKVHLSKTASIHHEFTPQIFFKEAHYTRLDLIEQISSLIEDLPTDFVSWCSHKKLNVKDFRAFLNDFKKEDTAFFSKISELDPTKNTGLQTIEFYFDLRAQKKIDISDVLKFTKPETLLTFFRKKRFSVSLSKDQAVSDELSKIKISGGVRASLKRNGDKRQIRLEVEADSPLQLKEKLEKSISRAESFDQAWKTEAKI